MAIKTEILVDAWRTAESAGHGQKQRVYQAAADRLGISLSSLYRELEAAGLKKARKKRSDAGDVLLPLDEVMEISKFMYHSYRNNNKKLATVKNALETLRSNGTIRAEYIDEKTGEVRLLSENACSRALRQYQLHPDQLRRPTPAVQLASRHPNHVWQIDASISVLFYVPESGVADMPPGEFYKNKPGNFEKIKKQRLTRYVVTDHTSGAIFAHYVAGGESIANLAESLLAAMAERKGESVYGVPNILYFDPGSGATKTFRRFLKALQIKDEIHKKGNSRATGQVEKGQDLVEVNFEAGFKYTDVPSLEWINQKARQFCRWFNATRKHTRHGKTRLNKWMEITPSQLRLANMDHARELLTSEPKACKVRDGLTISFKGQPFDVHQVPGVAVREKLMVTLNPLVSDRAWVVTYEDGAEVLHPILAISKDENGFLETANIIGEDYTPAPETQLDINRREIQRRIYEAATDAEVDAAAKAKALPFGGRLDPYKHFENIPDVAVLPRRGTELDLGDRPTVEQHRLSLPTAAMQIKRELEQSSIDWTPEHYQALTTAYPDGVPESEIARLVELWSNATPGAVGVIGQ
ncbi:integrase catalytic domain-containing protein [Oceanobacter mangrovi]|uniref:integrase catalytic domain-containing protein n=1 Tax=Oceanobacter mangrovi TaxID=2862510 RepID=UPI001C8DEFA3|nr:DDE-type integrase/transposase/recombinase [Oceanobacter mangrovi]